MLSICLAISINLSTLFAPGSSFAVQQAVGSGGHALDSNLRLGSGGYNRQTVSQRSQFHRPSYRLGVSPVHRLGYRNDIWASRHPSLSYQRRYDPLRSSASFSRSYRTHSMPVGSRYNLRR